jgi:glycosyltransferase involved in cell wall biosynthesis
MKSISFILPSRNNLELLKLAYKSIKNLKGNHEILILNDASIDGTGKWLDSLDDEDLIIYTNPGPERVGIVGMFDKGIEMARTDIIFAFHSDMVAGKKLDVNILQWLKRGKVVCATRIEPPLHPEGPEKVILDCGVEPENFDNKKFQEKVTTLQIEHGTDYNFAKTTEGIFAPWCMYKEDYLAVGGHDELFAPQSREDSDLFNRFLLKGYDLIQSWESFVYHFTSRGSRFNKYAGGDVGKDSPEWQMTNQKNMRNFIRKWGHMVKHDEMMKPIIPPKYDICFVVDNCTLEILEVLEPWCSRIYVEEPDINIIDYIAKEQKNTLYRLQSRVWYNHGEARLDHDIVVEFDASKLTNDNFQFLTCLPEVLQDSGEVGEVMEYDIFEIVINSLKTYEKDLIVWKK